MKFFHGDFTPQGFKRYSGLWKGPPPGNIGKKAWGDETENINCDDCGRWRQGTSLNPVSIPYPVSISYIFHLVDSSKPPNPGPNPADFRGRWPLLQDIAVGVAKLKEQMANPMYLLGHW